MAHESESRLLEMRKAPFVCFVESERSGFFFYYFIHLLFFLLLN